MCPSDATRDAALRCYGHVVEEQESMTLEAFLKWLGTRAAFPYPTASAERNMFLIGWAARALGAGLWAHWEDTIEPAVRARLAKAPVTNYAGD